MVITPSNSENNANVSIQPQIAPVNFIKAITKEIQPEEVQYVADVKHVISDCEECGCCERECDDIIYITKIIAFADKFRVLHWAAKSHNEHTILDDLCKDIESYKDAVAENIQAIDGQFSANDGTFLHIELPVGENPLEIINSLKICVQNWMECHKDDKEYEGCRNATSAFLESIYKYVYLLRLSK